MPTWVKVVLIIVIVGFVMLVLGIVLAARWVRTKGERLSEEGKAMAAEGQKFGEAKDAEACLAESLNRMKNCSGFICEAKIKLFLDNCLQTATVPPELCSTIPKQTAILDSARWQLEECERRGWKNNQRCTRLVQQLQLHCERQ